MYRSFSDIFDLLLVDYKHFKSIQTAFKPQIDAMHCFIAFLTEADWLSEALVSQHPSKPDDHLKDTEKKKKKIKEWNFKPAQVIS